MKGPGKAIGFLAISLCVLGAASPAMGRAPGTWTQITGLSPHNTSEVSLARTANGVLHVAWERPNPSHPASADDLLDRIISAAGVVGSQSVIAPNWSSIENPEVVATGGEGLDVFAGAIRSLKHTETITNLAWWRSTDGGATWGAPSEVADTGAADASDVSAAISAGGTPFEAWGSSTCLCVHMGTTPATPNVDFQTGLGHYGYEAGMARDLASGRLVVAWYSNGTGHTGVYAADIDPVTGARSGAPMRMPQTSVLSDGPFNGRTQVVGRHGGGVYVAYEGGYPTHKTVLLWRVGSSHSTEIAHNSAGVNSVGVASTPTGRLWVYWATSSSSDTPIIHVVRSNTSATAWGAPVTIKPPHHAATDWNLVGNGQARALDLVGSFSLGTSSRVSSWYAQVLPGLTLKASRTHLKTHTAKAQKVTFTVLDAGSAVSGVKLAVHGVSGTTNSKGQVTLSLGPFKHKLHLIARAREGGYTAASLTIRVS